LGELDLDEAAQAIYQRDDYPRSESSDFGGPNDSGQTVEGVLLASSGPRPAARDYDPPPVHTLLEASRHLPMLLRGVDLETQSRVEFLRQLTPNVSLNDYGLPEFVYRADLINMAALVGEYDSPAERNRVILEMLENARTMLDFSQGFPCFANGLPVWHQWDNEPREAFEAFAAYLEQPGARRIVHDTLAPWHPETINEWFHVYFWALRAKSWDMYRTAHQQRLRARRIMETEDEHYDAARKMIQTVQDNFKGRDLNVVDPDKLINMWEKLVKIQRVSAGLPALGEQKDPNLQPVQMDVAMKRMAPPVKPIEEVPEDVQTQEEIDLYDDPKALEAAQELIVSVSIRQGNGEGR
jgi:hypothetical protein